MIGKWANNQAIGAQDFETLHVGLTVSLVATPREQLMTCSIDERLSVVHQRNEPGYDFLPVVGRTSNGGGSLVGLLETARLEGHSASDIVADAYMPIAEMFLIGADASILQFVVDADEKPCRLVVSETKIIGLVSLSDLQKLPVRAALFALITGFEMTMMDAIRRIFPNDSDWMHSLTEDRRSKIASEVEKSKRADGFVEKLLFTQFCDKSDIIRKCLSLRQSKKQLKDQLREIEKLRNSLAHANNYASTPPQAKSVCALVRTLLVLRQEIAAAPMAIDYLRETS
jgi:hypothetical protein